MKKKIIFIAILIIIFLLLLTINKKSNNSNNSNKQNNIIKETNNTNEKIVKNPDIIEDKKLLEYYPKLDQEREKMFKGFKKECEIKFKKELPIISDNCKSNTKLIDKILEINSNIKKQIKKGEYNNIKIIGWQIFYNDYYKMLYLKPIQKNKKIILQDKLYYFNFNKDDEIYPALNVLDEYIGGRLDSISETAKEMLLKLTKKEYLTKKDIESIKFNEDIMYSFLRSVGSFSLKLDEYEIKLNSQLKGIEFKDNYVTICGKYKQVYGKKYIGNEYKLCSFYKKIDNDKYKFLYIFKIKN